jgi:glycerol-3-phosphate dehydrogenase
VGAIEYWDGTIDDARLVLTLVRTAASYGAHAASRTQVIELTKSGAGRVNGAVLKDLETGETFTVHAKHVINSTGVWTEETEDLAGGKGGLKVLASKGIHIVVPRDRIKGTSGLILQTEKSVLFVIPWSRYWIIGTTDTPWKQDFQHPVATKADIDYVLEHANAVLADPLTPDDIIGTYAGLRPLLQPEMKEGTSSAKVSREHTVAAPAPGFTVIAGGKLTTYRVMAEDAVDFALGAEAQGRPSVTNNIPLLGAVGLAAMANQTRSYQKKFGWSKQMIDHLLHRYGSMINEIVAICNDDPSMAQPVAGAEAYLRAEIHYAVTREGVLHLEDILLHRTRINYEFADRGLGALEDIASIAAAALGWDKKTTDSEIASYKARAAAEEAAENEPDDTSAEKVRLEAADLSPMEKLS